MKTATVREAQHHLSRLLVDVEAGEEIVITRRGKAVAKLINGSKGGESAALRRVDWSDSISRRNEALHDLPQMERNIVVEMREEERY